MRRALNLAGSVASIVLLCVPISAAQDADSGAAPPPTAKARELTPEEKAEKEAREAGKAKICEIIATRDPVGEDVSCDIVKTWREEDIAKMLGGKISWPWGKAVCQSKIKLPRATLAKAMTVVREQKVGCTLDQKKKGEPYVVELTMSPKVKFKDGKASEASVNWGPASAPLLIYPLIYNRHGLDNSSNVLGPEVVGLANAFTTKKCAEVKAELPAGKSN
jgi:hypothetical protein